MNDHEIAMGGKIYSLRVARRMTQEQLAQELCVSPAAVSKWERNQAIPDLEMLWSLADFFDCTLDELVGRNTTLLERVGIYDSEKQKCADIADELMKCAEISRQKGILAMGEELRSHYQGSSRFLPFAVSFVIQGCMKEMPPELISELLKNYATALPETERSTGKLIAAALPLILSGESTEILWEVMVSYIGMEYREKVKPMDATLRKTREEIREKLKGKEPYSSATVLLDPLVEADDFQIQTILRNIDYRTLAAAMYGASGSVVQRFFDNVSDTLLYFVNEDMEQWKGTEVEILEAQRKILELGELS